MFYGTKSTAARSKPTLSTAYVSGSCFLEPMTSESAERVRGRKIKPNECVARVREKRNLKAISHLQGNVFRQSMCQQDYTLIQVVPAKTALDRDKKLTGTIWTNGATLKIRTD
ncbi:hypothetical protein GALMADRAFT_220136 [Galerina marginata CBS 339.88]|uniref:Uncharacterized protein n=1 Tax=Galerina marginata (strain CBS 339.88) TaxID=685588 RepID=A0A067TWN1_GALM3|nr:hypothetical protein GALMADRAFT_220136 [Galerina marginata CBS 339.88]